MNALELTLIIALIAFFECGQCLNGNEYHLARFHVEASRRNLREGDNYNVTCWSESLQSLEALCGSLDNFYMQQFNNRLATNILNVTGIYHEVKAAQPKSAKEYTYDCMCNGSVIKSSKFMVGIKLNITDFECTFRDEELMPTLNCGFSKPQLAYSINPSTSFYLLFNKADQRIKCLTQPSNESRLLCTVPSSAFFKFSREYNFTLYMNDSLDELKQSFTLTKAQCIIMNKPGMNVTSLSTSSSSICLQWDDKQKTNHIGYNISWSVELSPNDSFKWTPQKPDYKSSFEEYCLEGLSWPNQNYTLIAMRRYNHSEAHWSEPLIYTFTTAPDIPSKPPTVWPGGYTRNHNVLRVYWQQLQQLEQNGPQFTYNIQVRNNHDNTEVSNLDIQVETNMATIGKLPPSESYQITIRSQNSKGLSKNSSHLLVARVADIEKRIPKYLKIDKNTPQISWQSPEQQDDLISYTIYCCVSNATERNRCHDALAIEAVQLDGHKPYYHSEKVRNDSYEWAVSANYNGPAISGGMLWRVWTPHEIPHEEAQNGIWQSVEGIVALVVLGGCIYILYRKCQYMSDIKVDLPLGVLYDTQEHAILCPSQKINPAEEIPKVLSANMKPLEYSHPIEGTTVVAEINTYISLIPDTTKLNNVEVEPPTYSSIEYVKMQSIPINSNSEYVMAAVTYR